MAKVQLGLMALAVVLAAIAGVAPVRAVAETQTAPQQVPLPPGKEADQPAPTKAPAVKPSETPAAQGLVGLNVFSSDGTRVGEVRSVATGANGEIVGLLIRTGGFLGFGGRIVSIPEGRFMRSGQTVRLDLDADQVSGLPEVKD
jgi:sporulation protein YlmC with PRC-barrel domain